MLTNDQLLDAAENKIRLWDEYSQTWVYIVVGFSTTPFPSDSKCSRMSRVDRLTYDKPKPPFKWGITKEQALELASTTTPIWYRHLKKYDGPHTVTLWHDGSVSVDGISIDNISLTEPY